MNYEFNLLNHVGVVAKRVCAAAAHEVDDNTLSGPTGQGGKKVLGMHAQVVTKPSLATSVQLTIMANTTFKVAMITSSVLMITRVSAEITLKVDVITYLVVKVTFVVAQIIFKVCVIASLVAKIIFVVAQITFNVVLITSSVVNITFVVV